MVMAATVRPGIVVCTGRRPTFVKFSTPSEGADSANRPVAPVVVRVVVPTSWTVTCDIGVPPADRTLPVTRICCPYAVGVRASAKRRLKQVAATPCDQRDEIDCLTDNCLSIEILRGGADALQSKQMRAWTSGTTCRRRDYESARVGTVRLTSDRPTEGSGCVRGDWRYGRQTQPCPLEVTLRAPPMQTHQRADEDTLFYGARVELSRSSYSPVPIFSMARACEMERSGASFAAKPQRRGRRPRLFSP